MEDFIKFEKINEKLKKSYFVMLNYKIKVKVNTIIFICLVED